MKIECKNKRDGGTVVDMPNGDGQKDTRYHFKPLDPRDPDSPHVAEVSAAHSRLFFKADADVYLVYEAAPVPTFEAPVTPPPPFAAPVAPPADVVTPATPVETPADPQVVAPAVAGADGTPGPGDDSKKDGDDDAPDRMTLRELRAGIGDGSLDGEKLRELLEAEQQSENPRTSIVETITKALK
jgi:hypothetical protein